MQGSQDLYCGNHKRLILVSKVSRGWKSPAEDRDTVSEKGLTEAVNIPVLFQSFIIYQVDERQR